MNRVSVYATGSCSMQTREGSSRVLIEQDGLKTVTEFTYQNTTAKRCVIQGLIDGIAQLHGACHVILVRAFRVTAVIIAALLSASPRSLRNMLSHSTF